jgi:hypothetical protein
MHGQATGAAGEQAAQQVVVLLVVPERQLGVARQLRLGAVAQLRLDDRRNRDRDPLLARPDPAAALAGIARLARARLFGLNQIVAVRVSGAGVDRLGQDVVDDRGRPGMPARARVPGPEVEPLEDLADGHPLLDQPAVEQAHERGFILVDLKPPTGPVATRDVAVAIGRPSADEPAGPRLLQLAAAEALAQQGPLVFGDRPLDL